MAGDPRRAAVALLALSCLLATSYAKMSEDNPEDMEASKKTAPNHSLAVFLMLALEIVAFLVGYILNQTGFRYIQEVGAAMIIGFVMGIVVRFVSTNVQVTTMVTFKAEFFFVVLLPPIMFESGYNMKRGPFFRNFSSIMGFAFVGTVISTFVTGFIVRLAVLMGIMTDLPLVQCHIFGAIVSATDTVAVLAIFNKLKVHVDLYSNIFGESVLNDAVVIVIFKTLKGFEVLEVTLDSTAGAVWSVLVIFIGSITLGTATGMATALIYKYMHLHHNPILETVLLSFFGYCSYFLADGMELSGIIAVVFCAMAMGHYTYPNLSHEAQVLSKEAFELPAMAADMLVFVYLGFAFWTFKGDFEVGFIIAGITAMLLSRAVHVFPISWMVNRTRHKNQRIPFRFQIFIWYAGLRGGVAFILALQHVETSTLTEEGTGPIFGTTMAIIVFTILGMGGATIPILEYLEVPLRCDWNAPPPEEPNKKKTFIDKLAKWDKKYITPWLTHAVELPGINVETHEMEEFGTIPLEDGPAGNGVARSHSSSPTGNHGLPSPTVAKQEAHLPEMA